jgi:hypothetical protein
MHVEFGVSVVASECANSNSEDSIEELLPQQFIGTTSGNDSPVGLFDLPPEFINRHLDLPGLRDIQEMTNDSILDVALSRHLEGQDEGVQANHALWDGLSDVCAGQAGDADHGEEAPEDFLLFLFLEALIDLVGRQGKTVAGVQADQLSRLPELRAIELDVNSEDWAALTIQDSVVSPFPRISKGEGSLKSRWPLRSAALLIVCRRIVITSLRLRE